MCGQRPGVGRREDAGEPHGPVAAGLLDAAQIVLLCDPVGVQRVSAVDVAVPQVDRRSRQGPEPLLTSSTVSVIVSGTPTATADADPKLVVMSLRTMPVSVRTLTPLEPSPGYGPAVSSGISVPVDDVTVSDSAPVEPAPDVLDGPGESAVSDSSVLPMPQLARAAARPAPPNNVSVRLRLSVGRSWERPLSWSCSSSSCVMRSPRSG